MVGARERQVAGDDAGALTKGSLNVASSSVAHLVS
jgi:hypothetical protein